MSNPKVSTPSNFVTTILMSSIGKRITEIRVKAGYSQPAFAKKLGIPQPTLSRYESDARRVPGEILFAVALGSTTVDFVLHGKEIPR